MTEKQLKEDLIRCLEEIGSKSLIEEMETKYGFNYKEELYRIDTNDRIQKGLNPLPKHYY